MREIWNKGNAKQRADLLKAIYGSNNFSYMGEKKWDELPYGVQARVESIYNEYKNCK